MKITLESEDFPGGIKEVDLPTLPREGEFVSVGKNASQKVEKITWLIAPDGQFSKVVAKLTY